MWNKLKNIYYNFQINCYFDACCITGGESSPYFDPYIDLIKKEKETNV